MADDYTLIALEDLEDVAAAHGLGDHWEARSPRKALEAERTGLMFVRLKPGKRSPFAHRHSDAEEVYVVLSGSGRAKLNDEIVDVQRLDAIRVSPQTLRAFEAGDDGLELLAFGQHHPGDGEIVKDDWTA